MIHVGDIRQLDGAWLPPVGVVTGGSPCQDLSIAGSRAGLAGSSSCLYLEQIRIVAEMRKATRGQCPRFMVWENVPGALSIHGGRDFLEVLNHAVKACDEGANPLPMPGKWTGAGVIMDSRRRYSLAWRVHDARLWGVPQRRRRIALVVDFGGPAAPEVLFEREGVRRNPAQGTGMEKAPAGTLAGGATESGKAYGLNGDTLRESMVYDARGNGDGKLAHTLTGDHDNRITNYTHVVVSIGNGQRHMSANAECAGTLNCMHDHEAVIICDRASYSQGANARYAPAIGYAEVAPTLTTNGPHAVSVPPRYTVRRLTPLECERLQGYPDNWTLIGPYWIDRRGKRRDGFADSPRYRALGNSIALPFWAVLMRRIHERLPESARTLGSLFDEIGGFPLVFPGEPVWASEIDDFCVAVTKKHFGTQEDTEATRELFRRFPPPWVHATKNL